MQTAAPTRIVDLSHEGLIKVSGADAVTFLQGQLSTDIEKLTADTSQLSSWSNAKGRVVTIVRLFRRDEAIYMALPASLLSSVKKRLSMYVLRSKVVLDDAGSTLTRLGLVGSDASRLLKEAAISVPNGTNGLQATGDIQVIRLHGEAPRYALYGPVDALAALRRKLEAAGAEAIGEDAWPLAKILVGEPTVYPETTEHFVAQMLGLDQLGAIDFKKGCYIGQEVIARAHYRGAVKRRMARGTVTGTGRPAPGTELRISGQGDPVAEVVDAQRDAAGVWQMLLVVQDDHREAAQLHAADGALVRLAKDVSEAG